MKSSLFILLILLISAFSQNPNTAISGTSDYYITFTPTTNNVVLSNPEVYDAIGEDLTMEIWFRKTIGPGNYRPILSKHPQTPGVITNIDNGLCEYLLEIQYNDALNFLTGCGSFAKYGYYVAVDQPTFYPSLNKYIVQRDRWTHVAVTVDWRQDVTNISTGIAKIYADGVLVDASLWAAHSPSCNGQKRLRQPGVPIRLGYYDNQDPGFQFWVGDMDEFRMWSVARTAEQIKDYYNGGIPIDSVGLVSYHTFSEGSGAYSNNVVLDTAGYPRVYLDSVINQWMPSDLKLLPDTAIVCPGYTITAQPIGPNGVDLYLTKIIQNTDAKFLWSDGRDPRTRNIRRQITKADLPLNLGPISYSNIFEYVPGRITGIDILYYEARNNGSYPEPSGPAALVFQTKCCGHEIPDSCRICKSVENTNIDFGPDGQDDPLGIFGSDNWYEDLNQHSAHPGQPFGSSSEYKRDNVVCEESCDKKGGVYDGCGVCNGNGLSCKGCDGIPFSSARYDLCGVCGGDSTSCFGNCSGVIDLCGICNGNNSCCATYKGAPVDRIDYILTEYSLNQLISKLEAARSLVISSLQFVKHHNKYYRRDQYWNPAHVDIPNYLPRQLSNRIISMNHFCSQTDEFIQNLDNFLVPYGQEIRSPWPPIRFPFSLQ